MQPVTRDKYTYVTNDAKLAELEAYVKKCQDEDFDYVSELPASDFADVWSNNGIMGFMKGAVRTAVREHVSRATFIDGLLVFCYCLNSIEPLELLCRNCVSTCAVVCSSRVQKGEGSAPTLRHPNPRHSNHSTNTKH
jgi:hypothetical protein